MSFDTVMTPLTLSRVAKLPTTGQLNKQRRRAILAAREATNWELPGAFAEGYPANVKKNIEDLVLETYTDAGDRLDSKDYFVPFRRWDKSHRDTYSRMEITRKAKYNNLLYMSTFFWGNGMPPELIMKTIDNLHLDEHSWNLKKRARLADSISRWNTPAYAKKVYTYDVEKGKVTYFG